MTGYVDHGFKSEVWLNRQKIVTTKYSLLRSKEVKHRHFKNIATVTLQDASP